MSFSLEAKLKADKVKALPFQWQMSIVSGCYIFNPIHYIVGVDPFVMQLMPYPTV